MAFPRPEGAGEEPGDREEEPGVALAPPTGQPLLLLERGCSRAALPPVASEPSSHLGATAGGLGGQRPCWLGLGTALSSVCRAPELRRPWPQGQERPFSQPLLSLKRFPAGLSLHKESRLGSGWSWLLTPQLLLPAGSSPPWTWKPSVGCRASAPPSPSLCVQPSLPAVHLSSPLPTFLNKMFLN